TAGVAARVVLDSSGYVIRPSTVGSSGSEGGIAYWNFLGSSCRFETTVNSDSLAPRWICSSFTSSGGTSASPGVVFRVGSSIPTPINAVTQAYYTGKRLSAPLTVSPRLRDEPDNDKDLDGLTCPGDAYALR